MADAKVCHVSGCEKRAIGRGWCSAHYKRWRLTGEVGGPITRKPGRGRCEVEGCGHEGRLKRGLCVAHHHRALRHGDPTIRKSAANGELFAWIKAHVDHVGDECLPWPFARKSNGYGKVVVDGAQIVASRMMCILAHGEPPTPRHEASHSCGKGHEGCMNPGHLRWDTPEGNQADKVLHGTDNRGEKQWKSKLTEADVLEIRSLLGIVPQSEIAKRFGIDPSSVSNIKSGKNWGWLA